MNKDFQAEIDPRITPKGVRIISAFASFIIASSLIFLCSLLAIGFLLNFEETDGVLETLLVFGIFIGTIAGGVVMTRYQYQSMKNMQIKWHLLLVVVVVALLMLFFGFTPTPFTYEL